MALRDLFMSEEARLRLPDVDEVLNVGYVVHVADDPAAGATAREVAQKLVRDFVALRSDNATEDAYLRSARGIVLSMGRGLTRKKAEWQKSLQDAASERDRKLRRVQEVRTNNFWLNLIWRLLGPLALWLMGYLAAQMFSNLVPGSISENTGKNLPGIAVGLVFVFLGRWVQFWLFDRKRDLIELEYRVRVSEATVAYEQGKIAEYKLYREQLCESWQQYTGEAYPETSSYALVMQHESESRQRMDQSLPRLGTDLKTLRRIIRIVRRAPRLSRLRLRLQS